MNTEKIYDEQIAPLMTKIIEICMKNEMPIFAHFPLNDADGERLACTTAACYSVEEDVLLFNKLLAIAKPVKKFAGIAVMQNDDGTKEAIVTGSEGYTPMELEILKSRAIADGLRNSLS